MGRLRHALGFLQSINEDETQTGQSLATAARSPLSLAEQIGLVLADVLRTQAVGTAMKVAGKIFHRTDVTLDGSWRVISTLEFFEHHLDRKSTRLNSSHANI